MSLSLVLTAALAAASAAQPPHATADVKPVATGNAPNGEQPAAEGKPGLPVSLDRIRQALAEEPKIKPDSVRPVFRVEVIGEKPTIVDLLGPDFWKGTAPGMPITHQELFAMVTPEQFRGTAMFTQAEAITVMATSVALQWALQKALQKYKEAKRESDREEARKEVQEALAALDKARAAAGLPKRSP
jgi:hypothetical protein